MRKGFSLIEILVSLLLIVSSLSVFFLSYREYLIISDKEEKINNTLQCLLAVKNIVNMKITEGVFQEEGKISNCFYSYHVNRMKTRFRRLTSERKEQKLVLYRVFCDVNNKSFMWDFLRYEE